ncbi:MAG: saccharopine dehydrogenase family protein [Solirubrobacteraceae bacterium]
MDQREISVAVLGAGGTIAPAIVADLAQSEEVRSMTLLDLDQSRAQAVADSHGGGKASAGEIDARSVDDLAAAIGEAGVLVNTASYRINLEAMRACLQAGCNYLDLGGLYWMTGRQRELGADFERAGLLAVLGIGSSPGKTNLMAARGVRELGEAAQLQTIDVMAAGRDPAAPDDGRMRPPYAIQTLLDELTLAPVVLRDGQPVEIDALTPGGSVSYGDPIGTAETIFTLHSELATFGESFGCRESSFRLSLAGPLLERLKQLVGASADEVAAAAREAASPSNETVSVHLVALRTADDRSLTVRAISRPHFGLGGSVVSTAAPAAATARLFARGSLTATGALPPERCIEPDEMFAELETRGCSFSLE